MFRRPRVELTKSDHDRQSQAPVDTAALEADSGAFLASIFASSSDCIKVLDLDGNLIFMTEGGQKVMEVSDFSAIEGRAWTDFWTGQGNDDAKSALATAKAGGSAQFSGFATTMAGTPKWWEVRVSPILGASGRPERILSISRDITETRFAAQALEASERQLRLALEAGRLGHWSLDLTNRTLIASPLCKQNFGRDAADSFTYNDLRASIHPDDADRVMAAIERTISTGDDYDIEYRVVRPDRTTGWVMIRGQLVRDEAGFPVAMSGVSLDIGALKQAEIVLAQSEARFKAFAQAMPNQVWSSTTDGRLDWFNDQVYAYCGLTFADLEGSGWAQIVHPDDVAGAAAAWAQALASGAKYETEFRLRRSDGEWRSHLARALPIRNLANEIERWIGTNTDIEDLKIAVASLAKSQKRAAAAIEAADIGTWEFLPASGELIWDKRCYELFGLRFGAPMSFPIFLSGVHPLDRLAVEEACVAAMQPNGARGYDIEYRTVGLDDGIERWVSAKGKSEFQGDTITRFIGTVRDNTKLKQAEAEQRLLTAELAHRIKNSMAMVSAIANQTFRAADTKEHAYEIFSSRLRALNTAHDILTASSWTSASMPLVVERALAPHRTGEGRITADGPAVTLSAKQALSLSLALHELATNAMKYGALSVPGGAVSVAWKRVGKGSDESLEFEWRETGGPIVSAPIKKGFGSRLIEATLSADFGGAVVVDYRPEGVTTRFATKLSDLATSGLV